MFQRGCYWEGGGCLDISSLSLQIFLTSAQRAPLHMLFGKFGSSGPLASCAHIFLRRGTEIPENMAEKVCQCKGRECYSIQGRQRMQSDLINRFDNGTSSFEMIPGTSLALI